MEINSSQKKAISHHKGAMMVLAGPGSGKTFVITMRTRELIEKYKVPPENILVITFTRAAAAQMKERFEKIYGRQTDVSFGTFHAIFFKIIKYAYSYDVSNILGEEDRYRILHAAINKLGLDIQDEKEFISGVSSEISLIKSEQIDPSNYYSTNCGAKDFQQLYLEYDKALRAENKIDYDDMMVICHELLLARPDILRFWQQRYEYILIDEFQDINLLQYKIVKLLSAPQNNIFIVGDDDQSIYGFRGAKPGIMLGFEKDFPQSEKVVLSTNYRCGKDIIKHSLRLVAHNKQRFDKQISGDGDRDGFVSFINFATLAKENAFVCNRILDFVKEGAKFSDTAVLYRMNMQPRALAEMLSDYNIPYRISDGLPNIYDHWIAKNMLTYLELAAGSRERRLFLQIANRPKRYISRDIFVREEMTFRELYAQVSDKPYVITALDKLRYDLDFMKCLDPYAAIKYIRGSVGYDEYLREYASARHLDEEELFETLNELEEVAKGFESLNDWKSYIEDYREKLKNAEYDYRTKFTDSRDAVRLMTFHSAKGLEFNNVIIIEANEGFTPHNKAEVSEDLEEERRMFYVAMTRAKERLYILSEDERFGKKLRLSRFVKEAQTDA